MDWCDITLYGYNVSNSATLNPWFADPQGANLDESRPFKTIKTGTCPDRCSRNGGQVTALTFNHAQNSFRFYDDYINPGKNLVFAVASGPAGSLMAPYEDNNHNPTNRGDDWIPE